jgi:hypothetical protein
MNIELTPEQRQAVQRADRPIRILDPDSRREYVLLRADLYERMRQVVEAEVVDPSFYEFEEPGSPS